MFSPVLNRSLAVFCLLVAGLRAEPADSAKTAAIARKMAQHLFNDSGYPVFVRQIDGLADCTALNAEDRTWIAQPGEVATEFLHDPGAICVSVLKRTRDTGEGTLRLDPSKFEAKFGTVPDGSFRVYQRLGFQFSKDPTALPTEESLNFFFLKVPRPLNLSHPGSLAAAVRDFESAEAGSKFATEVTGVSAKDRKLASRASESGPSSESSAMPWVILVCGSALFGIALFMYYRSRIAAAKRLLEAVPVVAGTGPQPVSRVAVRPKRADPGKQGREALSFPAHSLEDQKLLIEIDAVLRDMEQRGRVGLRELEAITKQTQRLHAMATKQGLPALELVREYLSDQLKEALRRNQTPISPVKSRA